MSLSDFQSVGFIGLGAMGLPMATQLANKLPKEIQLHVYDISSSTVDDLSQKFPERVRKATSAKDVAEKSEIILTMVPEGSHVKSVYLTPSTGICSAASLASKILIDCSTIDTATNLSIRSHLSATSPRTAFYDCPVSGGVSGANKASIAFFLGCSETDENLPRIADLLSLMGTQIIPCGGPSLGLAAKLSNNYLSGIIAIASSEALDMGMRSGLDPRTLSRVFSAGTAQNAICDRFNPCPGVDPDAPSSKGYKGGFKVQLMKKDFKLAVEMAGRVGAKNVLGGLGLETYEGAAEDSRCRDLDSRVVYRYLGCNEEWEKDE